MNVCFLLGGFTQNGGIGRVTSILANNLVDEEEYNIFTLSFFNTQKKNLYFLKNEIIQNFLFEKSINMKNALMLGAVSKMKRFLKLNKIDIVIACGALYFPISVFSCKYLNTKTICWEHSNVQNSKDHSFQLLCRKIGAKKANMIVTLTKHDKESYISKYHINNVLQIYNPVDENIIHYSNEYNAKSRKLLSVGRLSYQKNFGMLIEIAKEVLPNNSGWTWDIFGDGELRDELQSKINENGLEKLLFLKGQVNNLYSLYNEYAVLIMTSYYEGFPMTLLEGMALGLPLLSFDILTGPNEIIENGKNGYLVDPFDKKAMISCINYLLNSMETRILMSDNGKCFSGKYSLNEITNRWKRLFNSIT